jgi:fibronectin type 3 domain-containing protein
MRLPKAPSIRLTTSGKSVKVSWSKATGCKGYELYMSTSKNGTYSRIKSGNVTSYTKTGLVSGKTYYFKLRSYTKNAAGKNIYSSYGAVKSIKVK